jgi:small-conductance mechanosensitive channel
LLKSIKNVPATVLAVLLAGCLLAYFYTRESSGPIPTAKQPASQEQPLVDTTLRQNALNLALLAATPLEQTQAREAWRLADDELDLAFAAALREAEAAAEAGQPASGPLRQLKERAVQLKDRVEAGRRVQELSKDEGEALDLAKAQLELDEGELENAQEDLARAGGDRRARLQRLLKEHEASEKIADQVIKFTTPGPTGTMSEQVREWLVLGDYQEQLETAAQHAASHASELMKQHAELERQLPRQAEDESLERLRHLSSQRKLLTGLDQRAQDTRQISAVYRNWIGLVGSRRRAALHLALRSLALVFSIVLLTMFLNGVIYRALPQTDRRRLHQLRVIARMGLQVAAVFAILLIFFGLPTQFSTMFGLVTAGLTVVMKDFIVAFFGWFMLMGKNGVGVGDWVEIEGVSGEVIEIGLLKTVLLELGNWTESGHPTGRRVAFSNSFAMQRHYFNFSTAGQWLWDELRVTVPQAEDPYRAAEQIHDIVEQETKAESSEAAAEWARVTQQYGAREFAAGPAVSLRPGSNGLDVVVRYITRAPRRNAVKSQLFRAIVELLRKPESAVGTA